jgi:hypothetical protein
MARMRIECWIPKATNAHSEFKCSESVIAFPLQQLLHENSSLLRYTYIACPVILKDSPSYIKMISLYFTENSVPILQKD